MCLEDHGGEGGLQEKLIQPHATTCYTRRKKAHNNLHLRNGRNGGKCEKGRKRICGAEGTRAVSKLG